MFIWTTRPERKRRVGAAEAEGIVQRQADLRWLRLIGHVVEVAFGVLMFVVDCRRQHPARNRQHCVNRFDGARRTERMPGHRLGGADSDPDCVLAEDSLDGLSLGDIALRRRRAVCIDVVDFAGVELSVLQALPHTTRRAHTSGRRRGDVVGVAVCAVASDLGKDACASGQGGLALLQDECASALILEERQAAIARSANILAEVAGYGANSDAYHIASPSPGGLGAARCMQLCLEDGELDPCEVDYINAHGTSTPQGDIAETQAIKRVFGEHAARIAVSSTKSMTGHALGAAGAIESVYTVLTIARGIVPPTINYERRDPECDLDYVPNHPRAAKIRLALNNSFGFGGTNATLAFRPGGPNEEEVKRSRARGAMDLQPPVGSLPM